MIQACDPYDFVGNGNTNIIADYLYGQLEPGTSAIVDGSGNWILGTSASFIGAGGANFVSGGDFSAIVAGQANTVAGTSSFVGGGIYNTIQYGQANAIAGGSFNYIPYSSYSSILGGNQNTVSGDSGTISGGYLNTASGEQATISGGYGNTASGKDATIPGGSKNTAGGINSLAAGYRSSAGFNGDFVWSDYLYGSSGASATAQNQFVARATGGFYLYSAKSLIGVALAPGSGAWSTLSDRNVKTGVENVDDARILTKLAAMPVSEWSYTSQGTGVRHLGPMAQDFRAAFGLGEDERHISTVDEEGVALAAIKALKADNDAKAKRIAADEARLALLEDHEVKAKRSAEERLAHLEARLAAIEAVARSTHSR